jgi:uncharacterized protein (TIGR02996 family)
MSDEEALLAAIAAHPEEDTPRLAYADWLDENDQPARAEFIRLQIELATLTAGFDSCGPRFDELHRRERELLAAHRADILGSLGEERAGVRYEFDRGFVRRLSLDAGAFTEHAAAVAALKPAPRDVTVHGVIAAWRDVVTDPHFGLVTRLVMQRANQWDDVVIPDVVRRMGERARPNRVRALDFKRCRIGDEGLIQLVAHADKWRVAELDLSNNGLTDEGIDALVGSPMPVRLRRLVLSWNPITERGAVAIARGWPADQPLSLTVSGSTLIGTAGWSALHARFGFGVSY